MEAGAAGPAEIELREGALGAFEIVIDGKTRFSKLKTGRFPDESELDALA